MNNSVNYNQIIKVNWYNFKRSKAIKFPKA